MSRTNLSLTLYFLSTAISSTLYSATLEVEQFHKERPSTTSATTIGYRSTALLRIFFHTLSNSASLDTTAKMISTRKTWPCRLLCIPLLFTCFVYYFDTLLPLSNQLSTKKCSSSSPGTSQHLELEPDLLEIVNIMATSPSDYLPRSAGKSTEVNRFLQEVQRRRSKFLNSSQACHKKLWSTSRTVHIATAACEKRGTEEGLVMLKSAILFGQDTNVHAYVFTDPKSIAGLSLDLLELKWAKDVLGNNFTFTVLKPKFPNGWNANTYAPCATQRLFFPSALPEVDAVLYLDADTLVLSNLTRIWGIFEGMNATAVAAIAPNTVGPSNKRMYWTPEIPIYGNRGLNAGIMLMNLTRMRDFGIEERAIAVELLYRDKLWLADQDIYNILFHVSPDKLYVIDCSYNFYYVHCDNADAENCGQLGTDSCFCEPTLKTGVKVLHGVGGAFRDSDGFMGQAYTTYKKMSLLHEDPSAVVEYLASNFCKLGRPCSNLTAEALYGNALEYLKAVQSAY